MPSIIAALHLKDSQAGSLSDALHPDLSRGLAGGGLARRSRAALPAGGRRRARLERWRRSGRAWRPPSRRWCSRARSSASARPATRSSRRRCSPTTIPTGAPRARAGDLLRRDPDRLGAGVRAGRRDRRALRLAVGVLRRGRARRGAGAAAALPARSAARRAWTREPRRRRGEAAPSPRRSLVALLRDPELPLQHGRADIYTFTVGGLAVWMPTYFVRVRHLPLASADLTFGGVLALAGLVGTLVGGRLGDRMARSATGRPLPAVRRGADRVAALHGRWRSSRPRLLSSGPRCSSRSRCSSSTPGRSTRPWPTSCRRSCAAAASPSTRWRSTCSATRSSPYAHRPRLRSRRACAAAGAGHGRRCWCWPGLVLLAGAPRAGARPGAERRAMSDARLRRASSTPRAKIALEAAALVRGYHGKRLVIESKAGNEPVTEADQRRQRADRRAPARRLPRRRHPLRGDPRRRRAPGPRARLDGRSHRRHAATSSWATPASS